MVRTCEWGSPVTGWRASGRPSLSRPSPAPGSNDTTSGPSAVEYSYSLYPRNMKLPRSSQPRSSPSCSGVGTVPAGSRSRELMVRARRAWMAGVSSATNWTSARTRRTLAVSSAMARDPGRRPISAATHVSDLHPGGSWTVPVAAAPGTPAIGPVGPDCEDPCRTSTNRSVRGSRRTRKLGCTSNRMDSFWRASSAVSEWIRCGMASATTSRTLASLSFRMSTAAVPAGRPSASSAWCLERCSRFSGL